MVMLALMVAAMSEEWTRVSERFTQAVADEGRAALTVAAYRRGAAAFLAYVHEIGGWLKLDRAAVTEYLRRHTAPSSRRWHLAVVRRLCGWLVAEEALAANPAAKVRGPALRSRGARPVTEDEDAAILQAAEAVGAEAVLLIRLLQRCGLRVGEITGRPDGPPGIRLGDLDLTHKVVRIVGKGGTEGAGVPAQRDG